MRINVNDINALHNYAGYLLSFNESLDFDILNMLSETEALKSVWNDSLQKETLSKVQAIKAHLDGFHVKSNIVVEQLILLIRRLENYLS